MNKLIVIAFLFNTNVFTGYLVDVIMREGQLLEFKRHTPPRRTAKILFELPHESFETMKYGSIIDAQREGRDFYAVVSKNEKELPRIEYLTAQELQHDQE